MLYYLSYYNKLKQQAKSANPAKHKIALLCNQTSIGNTTNSTSTLNISQTITRHGISNSLLQLSNQNHIVAASDLLQHITHVHIAGYNLSNDNNSITDFISDIHQYNKPPKRTNITKSLDLTNVDITKLQHQLKIILPEIDFLFASKEEFMTLLNTTNNGSALNDILKNNVLEGCMNLHIHDAAIYDTEECIIVHDDWAYSKKLTTPKFTSNINTARDYFIGEFLINWLNKADIDTCITAAQNVAAQALSNDETGSVKKLMPGS